MSDINSKTCLYEELGKIILELQRCYVDGVIPEKGYSLVLDDFEKAIVEARNAISLGTHTENQKANNFSNWIFDESGVFPPDDVIVLVQVSGKPCNNIELDNALELASYCREDGWILEHYPDWSDVEPVAWCFLPEPYDPKDKY